MRPQSLLTILNFFLMRVDKHNCTLMFLGFWSFYSQRQLTNIQFFYYKDEARDETAKNFQILYIAAEKVKITKYYREKSVLD